MTSDITRREALRRAAMLLGGTLSAPTIAGVLAGCTGSDDTRTTASRDTSKPVVPSVLTADQRGAVLAIASVIIPDTETPGARAAQVDAFVDAMVSQHMSDKERQRFLTGLTRLDARATRAHGKSFTQLTPAEQTAMVAEMDRLAFSTSGEDKIKQGAPDESPRARTGNVQVGEGVGSNPAEAATPPPDTADVGSESFFRLMKELAVVGYYTSEVGATRELRVNPMVRYHGIPYTPGMPSWA